jgi:hypothetical protein
MSQAINQYKADLRDVSFLLFEQFGLGDLLGKAPFTNWGREEIEAVLGEVYAWSCAHIGVLNAAADKVGCKLVDGKVITPTGFGDAWLGRHHVPHRVPGGQRRRHGQDARPATPTAASTSPAPRSYISSGDQDFTDNVIHLVLARIDGAPPGTKGLSLFIVPKMKMNEDGSSARTTTSRRLARAQDGHQRLGDLRAQLRRERQCVGELIGTVENLGMPQMFKMMNGARIGVGLQGVALASTAYLNALEYAKDRKQGSSITRGRTRPRRARRSSSTPTCAACCWR